MKPKYQTRKDDGLTRKQRDRMKKAGTYAIFKSKVEYRRSLDARAASRRLLLDSFMLLFFSAQGRYMGEGVMRQGRRYRKAKVRPMLPGEREAQLDAMPQIRAISREITAEVRVGYNRAVMGDVIAFLAVLRTISQEETNA